MVRANFVGGKSFQHFITRWRQNTRLKYHRLTYWSIFSCKVPKNKTISSGGSNSNSSSNSSSSSGGGIIIIV